MAKMSDAMRARETRCKFYNGMANKICAVGVTYADVRVEHERMTNKRGHSATASFPCLEIFNLCGATCDKRAYPTVEEVEAEEKEDARCEDLMRRGLSSCCEAPFDRSQVILEGRHKGHGPRFCSKCRRCCFMV